MENNEIDQKMENNKTAQKMEDNKTAQTIENDEPAQEMEDNDLERKGITFDKMDINLLEGQQDIENTICIEDISTADDSAPSGGPDMSEGSMEGPHYFSKKTVLLGASVLVLLSLLISIIIIKNKSDKSPYEYYSSNVKSSMVYSVSSAIGDRHQVKFKLIIPCNSPEEKKFFTEKLTKIKHELIITGSHPQIERALEEKDFEALEKHILGIAHNLILIPAENLALKDLSLDQP